MNYTLVNNRAGYSRIDFTANSDSVRIRYRGVDVKHKHVTLDKARTIWRKLVRYHGYKRQMSPLERTIKQCMAA